MKTFGFGVGIGNVEYWMENFRVYETFGILNVHNWWVEILVNFGIFIFVRYVLFYSSLVRSIYRIYRFKVNTFREKIVCESLLLSL